MAESPSSLWSVCPSFGTPASVAPYCLNLCVERYVWCWVGCCCSRKSLYPAPGRDGKLVPCICLLPCIDIQGENAAEAAPWVLINFVKLNCFERVGFREHLVPLEEIVRYSSFVIDEK